MLKNLAREGSDLHSLMSGALYKAGAYLEDPRAKDIPPSAKLFEKLRQRIYSILFFEKPPKNGQEPNVEEWFTAGPKSLDQAVVKRIENAPDYHPGLEALWNEENSFLNALR